MLPMAGWVKEEQKGGWGRKEEQKLDRNRCKHHKCKQFVLLKAQPKPIGSVRLVLSAQIWRQRLMYWRKRAGEREQASERGDKGKRLQVQV